jgi:hypothetical protein
MIATDNHHIAEAITFFHRADLYFAIGRTTAWADEEKPPAEVSSVTSVEEVVAYIKVGTQKLVVPAVNGEIVYRGTNFTEVLEDNAYTSGAKYVYLMTQLLYDSVHYVLSGK